MSESLPDPKPGACRQGRARRRKRRFAGLNDVSRNAAESLAAGGITTIVRDIDRRTTGYRLFRDTQAEILSDMGGEHMLTALERRLVQHAACLTAFIESEESRLVAGLELRHPDLVLPAINTLQRLAKNLGLRRRAKKVEPTLEEYLERRRQEQEQEQDVDD